ncbi:hypothetical protein DSO57_1009998 [Entomophthora muscae]|uniref:Uncharacterized protein n=1 Tax=Entomophthora muscae TaxID=34485 RepID=A0ACC2RLF2_9FUNG|nr:hypothetical protein DSO57_1009998 [Entomophthora muscae]
MQLTILYLGLVAVAKCAWMIEEALGFDPSILLIPDKTANDLTRYFDPKVITSVIGQIKRNPPQRLATPGTQVPVSSQDMIDSFEMAYMSLCPSRHILAFQCICRRDYTTVEVVNNKRLQASAIIAVFPKRRTITVSYKFTKSIRNWVTNFDFQTVQMPHAPDGVKVHRGMYRHYLSIHNQTMNRVSLLLATKCQGCRIMATGYSLGASIAVISAPGWHEFKQTHDVRVDVIAYSGPRTGNLAAKLYFESLSVPITRYTNQNDFISMLPPRSFGYVHAGVEIYEHASSNSMKTVLRTCHQDYDEDPNCQWRETRIPSAIRHAFPLNQFVPLPPYCNSPNPIILRLPSFNFHREPKNNTNP